MMEKLNITDVKMHHKGNYKNHNCSICSNEEETTRVGQPVAHTPLHLTYVHLILRKNDKP